MRLLLQGKVVGGKYVRESDRASLVLPVQKNLLDFYTFFKGILFSKELQTF